MARIDLTHRIIQPTPPAKTPSSVRWHPWRRALQVMLGIMLVLLPLTNGLRLDVREQVFYFAWHRMAAHDMMLLFWIGITALWMLIAVSFLYGRFWCGWVCPQTLASDFADSLKKRIDKAFRAKPGRASFIPARAIWSAIMIAMSLGTGMLLVAYWIDPHAVGNATLHPASDPGAAVPVYFIAGIIAADLLWIRRKFCSGVCPYGLLISSIADKETLAVRYLDEREDDCIKCGQCVNVCPMGIDIKKGVGQMECIGCGECVDACNDVLGRRDIPGLIEYRFGIEPEREMITLKPQQRLGLWDAKRVVILAITLLCVVAVFFTAFSRGDSTATLWSTGRIHHNTDVVSNVYNMNLKNGLPETQTYRVSVEGLPGATLDLPGSEITLEGHDALSQTVTVLAPPSSCPPNKQIEGRLVFQSAHQRTETPFVFIAPRQ